MQPELAAIAALIEDVQLAAAGRQLRLARLRLPDDCVGEDE